MTVGPRLPRVSIVATLAAGSAVLAATLAVAAGSWPFYGLGTLGAAIGFGGSLLSGPVPWRDPARSHSRGADLAIGAAVGVAAFAGFAAAKLVVDRIAALDHAVASVLERADTGRFALVLFVALANAVGEEAFFRGALYDALPVRHRSLAAVALYVGVTAATLNISLVTAAVVMGALFTGVRARSGGVLVPAVTHVVWSVCMLTLLPR